MKSVLFIAGPTGSGKSELAIALAKRFDGEIVSCDSMQIYRGMDIGTDKPTIAQRRRVKHHLLDLMEPALEFSVYQFREKALRLIEEIGRRGKLPIVVGGSGLYMKALYDGMGPHPSRVGKLRMKLKEQARTGGLAGLYARLETVDPKAASRIHPHDERRILRALEVYERSGVPITEWEKHSESLESRGYRLLTLGLRRDRRELYDRIEKRVDSMFRRGFLAEVRRLAKKRLSQTARQAVGYREVLECLKGEGDPAEAKERIKKRTRNIAKKQMIWFRRDPRVEWVEVEGETLDARVLQGVSERLRQWLSSPVSHIQR